ncbi:MAG: ABC transporter substrate-binding protein [Alphaproteobacteria bacterium]|nr:ABC transporter substrate-binding protein [Alphaproteobacteria bacterium]
MRLRQLVRQAACGAAVAAVAAVVFTTEAAAQDKSLVIAYEADLQHWDPSANYPTGMSLYKTVYDSPLMQAADLKLIPNVISKWEYVNGDPLTLKVSLRDDVTFHNGDKLTAEDFEFSFETRPRNKQEPIDFAGVWMGYIKDIEVLSPTEAVVHFNAPMPTVLQWWSFLGSYILPKKYYTEAGGLKGFLEKPVGSGPYRLVDYQRGSRIVLEAYDGYWGGKAKIKNVTFQIITDSAARVAAIQSGQADMAINVPIREALRLDKEDGISAVAYPYSRIFYIGIANKNQMLDEYVRLAMHHAIDKKALSDSLFQGTSPPLTFTVTPDSPGYVAGYEFAYDPERAKKLLTDAGYGPDRPVKLTFYASNGAFPNDYEMARAIVAMWKKVHIDATLEVIELSKFYDLTTTESRPEAWLYSWDNSSGDPEIYTGYMLNPRFPFSFWREESIGRILDKLFTEADYEKRMQGYRDLHIQVAERSLAIPLLQSVATAAYKDDVAFTPHATGWIMPFFMDRK